MNIKRFKQYTTNTLIAASLALACLAIPASPASANDVSVGGVDKPGGTIKGTIKFDGRQAKRKTIRMSADAYCDGAHKSNKALNERYVFGENNTLVNVFVWVSKWPKGSTLPVPDADKRPKVDQLGCIYVPHVSGVAVNQEIDIVNSDNTLHNVKMNSSNNGSFNEGMPVKGMVLTKKFGKPEAGIPLKCDVHPWMGAYLHVVEHPFFATSGQDGTFEIRGLPAGDYELSVWHEFDKFAPDQTTIKVSVKEGDTQEVTVTYGPKKKK